MALADIIAAEIRQAGPIPFSRFMDLALYHPRHGYYRGDQDPFGRGGDFVTNAQVQPVFGRLIAQQVDRWRQELGAPDAFTVLELGPGRGETAAEARRCLPGVEWIEIERGGRWPDRPVTGVVFCNEFFDALPVDLVERRDGAWIEWRVDLDGERFVWRRAGRAGTRLGLPRLAQGRRIETCERALEALDRMAGLLARGWILAIDYGYTRAEIERTGRFGEGSLMSYARHRADPDVLREPGRRDITAHVNFSALADRGAAAGLEVFPLQFQQAFLLGVGEADGFANALAAASERRSAELRGQLKTLLFGMGETFRVLTMRRA